MTEAYPAIPVEQASKEPPLTEVEAFDGVFPTVQGLIEDLGKEELTQLVATSIVLGGRTSDGQGVIYKPLRDAYNLTHLRAGFDPSVLKTDEPMKRISPSIGVIGSMATWELFRVASSQQGVSLLEGEQTFDNADYKAMMPATYSMYNSLIAEKLAWAQIRDEEESHGRQVDPLHGTRSGLSNVTAHISIALANLRGTAILTEDQQVLLDTYRHMRDTRREISGEKRTYKIVRQLLAAMDNKELNDMQLAVEDADQQGMGTEIIVRALWCRAIDDTMQTIVRLKEKRAVAERAQSKEEHMKLIDHFRKPHVSESIHAIMREQAIEFYEDIVPKTDEAQTSQTEDFTVDVWVDDLMFDSGEGGGHSKSDTEVSPDNRKDAVPSEYVDRERLEMLARIKNTWTKGALSIGSLFEGKRPRRYKTEDGEIFTDKYYGVVVPVYDKDDIITSHFLVAESAVAGRNVTIVYRSDIGDLPWQKVASMSKEEARTTKGVRFLQHTKVGERSVVETTEEKVEFLFTCSPQEYEHGKFSGETAKGELGMYIGRVAIPQTVEIAGGIN